MNPLLRKNSLLSAIGVLLGLHSAVFAQQENEPPQLYSRSAELMGVEFRISLYSDSEARATEACEKAFARISQIESRLSNYQADSEVNMLCQSDKPVLVSDDLWFVLQESVFYWKVSEGAFDVTVGRLTRLWRRARRMKQLPAAERLREESLYVGSQYLLLNPKDQTVAVLKPGVLIDLGAIGKGYAADQAMLVLRSLGIGSAVINASGDVLFGDPPPGKSGWPAAVSGLDPNGPPRLLEPQANTAIATSGDAYQHLEIDGRRYSHIIDPRNGSPVRGRSSVSVLANSGLRSDALASAVAVLGPRAGLKLIESLAGTEATVLYQRREGKAVGDYRTVGFPLKSKN